MENEMWSSGFIFKMIKTKIKLWAKKQLKNLWLFLAKKRFIRSYRKKKFILIVFLVFVDCFIWNDVVNKYCSSDFEEKIVIENKKDVGVVGLPVAHASEQPDKNEEEKIESNPSTPQGVVEKIKEISAEENFNWKIVYGILLKESGGDCSRIGDTHLPQASYGCYQINRGYHPEVTEEQAGDIDWSTRWTIQRLKRYAHLGEFEMIRSHNGLVADHSNDQYVEDVYSIMSRL